MTGRTAAAWTRAPAFWIAYTALAAIALGIAWKLFPLAIPLVNLDITFSRAEALARAGTVAASLKLAPDDARSAVRFAHDSATQNYVELEGGGKQAFGALVQGDLYAPYWWDVRLFSPGDVNEVTIRFSATVPDYGRPPPLLGEHTAEVLRRRLELSDTEIAALAARGVIEVRA